VSGDSGVEEVYRRRHTNKLESRHLLLHVSRIIFRKFYWRKLCNLDKNAYKRPQDFVLERKLNNWNANVVNY